MSQLFIGLMSGTSLDGVDGVLAEFPADGHDTPVSTVATAYIPFPAALREDLMALQAPADNEIHREAVAANLIARHYAACVAQLTSQSGIAPAAICAIGAHGQTIRHRPEAGYTRQINNPSLLAELSSIDVIADFRSRDIAAGGQGAPLVPAFHQAIFGTTAETRVVANIGGISNISVLDHEQQVIGFDTGPGNVLMDAWVARHLGTTFDADGAWAAGGRVIPSLLQALLDEAFLKLVPPKSTGRDLFHSAWLEHKLSGFADAGPQDVQATLTEFTAVTLANAIADHAKTAKAVYVCGGGAYNAHLMHRLQLALTNCGHAAQVASTDALGVSPNHVEALAFAWLAYRHIERKAGNLPSVTGAKGLRILGALYPA
ncbi:anhydro-N-acetylmuramic acid kinase [Noviherbaspirillum autotrophicum]|uniref:Anhydro-N-acetylmuramic acid kinase n=1 Tax=Noviherbaspirillum autotrophicum TaxID=709839 RepID=A0A0C2BSZ2_9BURK|nr:anhydro-N-acetylmuramic acid kinase [Noviherbaspirillum autotrophicum]KIF81176.1 anhydro-N-acetylmuramic acid kinase [Noviherbaspirillum autotrophicum]